MLKPVNIEYYVVYTATKHKKGTFSHRYNNCTYIQGALKRNSSL